jgi:predicted metallo-beta-lactamase superfamily hydrolase
MPTNESTTIKVACPCCDAMLTIDPTLAVVLDHKMPVKPHMAVNLKDAVNQVKGEAGRRDEKYQQLAEAEKNKSKVLEAKFQELFKKAKEEPITKPLKDIDLD